MPESPETVESLYGDRLLLLSDEKLHENWTTLRNTQEFLAETFKSGFKEAIKKTGRELVTKTMMELLQATATGNPIDVADWGHDIGVSLMKNLYMEIGGPIYRAIVNGIRKNMPGPMFDLLEYDRQLPEAQIRRFAEDYTRNVVFYMNDTSRLGCSRLMHGLLEKGVQDNAVGRIMLESLGVDVKWANAMINYREGLVEANKSKSFVERALSQFADRAIDNRSELFSQTETMTAMNFGQQMLWEQIMLDDKLPPGTRKVWITAMDERVCPVCEPMDKVAVPMGERFKTKSGKLWVPPAHPRCRCTIIPDIFLGTLGEVHARIIRSRNRGKVAA